MAEQKEKDLAPTLGDMLKKGVFRREEIPPCFDTASLGALALHDPKKLIGAAAADEYEPHKINVLHKGSIRRQFCMPNPEIHTLLCAEVVKNWGDLYSTIDQSSLSISKPRLSSESAFHALTRESNFEERARKRVALASRFRFLLITDVEQFYPSVYTHSISWAAHGKDRARERSNRKNRQLYGNQLDHFVSRGQDGQTKGIPVGPDTSFLIGELLLSQVDRFFEEDGKRHGFRFVDDYEFGCASYSEAQRTLGELQSQLAEFELSLNVDKTRIIEGPIEMERRWVHSLRDSSLEEKRANKNSRSQYYAISAYIDSAIELHRQFEHEPVLKYALSRLFNIDCHEENLSLIQGFALQAAISEPTVLPLVLDLLLEVERKGLLNKTALSGVLNAIIIEHRSTPNTSAVTWALWGCHLFNITPAEEAVNAAISSSDAMGVVLLIEGLEKGKIKDTKNSIKDDIKARAKRADLRGKDWLLAYEAKRNKWFGRTRVGGKNSPFFDLLFSQGIRFFDPETVAKIREKYERGTEWSNYVNDDYQSDASDFDEEFDLSVEASDFDDDIPF